MVGSASLLLDSRVEEDRGRGFGVSPSEPLPSFKGYEYCLYPSQPHLIFYDADECRRAYGLESDQPVHRREVYVTEWEEYA